jgi:hypothetical protein
MNRQTYLLVESRLNRVFGLYQVKVIIKEQGKDDMMNGSHIFCNSQLHKTLTDKGNVLNKERSGRVISLSRVISINYTG